MPTPNSENTLTVDTNVVKYCFDFIASGKLPTGMVINDIEEFFMKTLEEYPIAINDFIKSEYETHLNHDKGKFYQLWFKNRLAKDLFDDIEPTTIKVKIVNSLRDDYKFPVRGKDMKFLTTAVNTIMNHLVTENSNDFCCDHRKGKKFKTADQFIAKNLKTTISGIDTAYSIL